MERTLVILKPGALQRGLVGELITTIDFQYLLYFETQQGYKL